MKVFFFETGEFLKLGGATLVLWTVVPVVPAVVDKVMQIWAGSGRRCGWRGWG